MRNHSERFRLTVDVGFHDLVMWKIVVSCLRFPTSSMNIRWMEYSVMVAFPRKPIIVDGPFDIRLIFGEVYS